MENQAPNKPIKWDGDLGVLLSDDFEYSVVFQADWEYGGSSDVGYLRLGNAFTLLDNVKRKFHEYLLAHGKEIDNWTDYSLLLTLTPASKEEAPPVYGYFTMKDGSKTDVEFLSEGPVFRLTARCTDTYGIS